MAPRKIFRPDCPKPAQPLQDWKPSGSQRFIARKQKYRSITVTLRHYCCMGQNVDVSSRVIYTEVWSIPKQLPEENPRNILARENQNQWIAEKMQLPIITTELKKEALQMTGLQVKDAKWTPAKSCLMMDNTWEEKTWQILYYLEENSSSRA